MEEKIKKIMSKYEKEADVEFLELKDGRIIIVDKQDDDKIISYRKNTEEVIEYIKISVTSNEMSNSEKEILNDINGLNEFRIVSIKKISETPCYDTKWEIIVKCDKKQFDKMPSKKGMWISEKDEYVRVNLTRFDGETEEKMREKLAKCNTLREVCDLHLVVWYD